MERSFSPFHSKNRLFLSLFALILIAIGLVAGVIFNTNRQIQSLTASAGGSCAPCKHWDCRYAVHYTLDSAGNCKGKRVLGSCFSDPAYQRVCGGGDGGSQAPAKSCTNKDCGGKECTGMWDYCRETSSGTCSCKSLVSENEPFCSGCQFSDCNLQLKNVWSESRQECIKQIRPGYCSGGLEKDKLCEAFTKSETVPNSDPPVQMRTNPDELTAKGQWSKVELINQEKKSLLNTVVSLLFGNQDDQEPSQQPTQNRLSLTDKITNFFQSLFSR